MPLAHTLADVLLIVGNGNGIQGRLRLEVADGELHATVLKTMAQHIQQALLLHSAFKCLVKLANGVDRTHTLKALPCQWLGCFDKVRQRDDIQCHALVFLGAKTAVCGFLPAAFFGNEVFLNFTLEEFLCLIHTYKLPLSSF